VSEDEMQIIGYKKCWCNSPAEIFPWGCLHK